MTRRKTLFILLLAPLFLQACDNDLVIINNSYLGGEEYVDEPLSNTSIKYKAHLLHSNRLINYVRTGDAGKIYAAASSEFRNDNERDSITNILGYIDAHLGNVVEFKDQQWSFATTKSSGVSVVYSSKIVFHEKGEAIYHFGYVDKEPIEGYFVFHVNTRHEGEDIGDVVTRVIRQYDDD